MKWIKEHPFKTGYLIGGLMFFTGLLFLIPWSPVTLLVIGAAIIFFTTVAVTGDV
jgi:hypothetical protein